MILFCSTKYSLFFFVFFKNQSINPKMKNYILVFLLSFVTFSSYSQSVDLDREHMKVSYVRLPSNPVLDENFRTFSINVNASYISRGAYPRAILEDKIILDGFEKVDRMGSIQIEIQIDDVIINNVEIKKREVVKKDKEGEITSRKTYYKPVITYTTSGRYYLKDHTEKPPNYGLGRKSFHTGSEYNSHSAAYKYFNNNRGSLKNKFTRDFIESIPGTINGKINYRYGYSPMNHKALLWILDSKKNPENEGHKKALADIQEVFKEMTFGEPIDAIKTKAQPIITYFESVIPKFSDVKKKKHKKMRYASYFNIAYIYYYLDMPDKAIEYANKLIENGYDKGDGKKILKEADLLKARFATNKINTRHFEVITIDNSAEDQVIAEEVDEYEEGLKFMNSLYEERILETVLINHKGERVDGSIKVEVPKDAADLDMTFHYKSGVKLMTLGDNDEIKEKKYYPRENVSFTVDDVEYVAVKFNSANDKVSKNVVDISGALYSFAEVLYKSDKLSLYSCLGELILKKAGDKTGSSTSKTVWKIGFKKKLAKLVEDCPELTEKVFAGNFKNDVASLTNFVKEYSEKCK